jgi:DNA-3-methyladenine glycosylase
MKRLSREFYTPSALVVAPQLLGKYLIHRVGTETYVGQITEVEAYMGSNDPASHAYRGKSNRNASMFLAGGHAYVYLIYGLHYCVNVVCGFVDDPTAVLIRSVKPISENIKNLTLNGPAKLTKAMHITKEQDGIDVCISNELWLEDRGETVPTFSTSPRIGISKNTEVHWRFFY